MATKSKTTKKPAGKLPHLFHMFNPPEVCTPSTISRWQTSRPVWGAIAMIINGQDRFAAEK